MKGLCGEHRKVARRKKLPKTFWHATCSPPRAKSKVKLFLLLKKLSYNRKKVLQESQRSGIIISTVKGTTNETTNETTKEKEKKLWLALQKQ